MIYRIQNKNGDGCYRSPCISLDMQAMVDRHEHDMAAHPNPFNDSDGQFTMKDGHLCGFESAESLHKWFSEGEIKMLAEAGFFIYGLRGVKVVEKLPHQLVFKKTRRTKIIRY